MAVKGQRNGNGQRAGLLPLPPQYIFLSMKERSPFSTGCFAAFLLATLFCCCGSNGQNSKRQSPFNLYIRAAVAGVDLQYDTVYHDASQRAFTISDFRYYLSAIRAIRADGTEQPVPCAVILADPGKKKYALGNLPDGNYKGFRFTVGLDSALNHGDPTVFDPGHPLAIQSPNMHWDWNSGYLFMKIEGRVDTTAKGRSLPSTEFFYHIGMGRMKRTVDLPMPFTVGTTADDGVRIKFDLATLVGCINWPSELSTHSLDNLPLAARIADRWQEAFSIDK